MLPLDVEPNGAEIFIEWAQSAKLSPEKLPTLAGACDDPSVHQLKDLLVDAWPNCPIDALACLAVMTAQLKAKSPHCEAHYLPTGIDAVAAWALASPMRGEGVDPNHARFNNWVDASDWESFFMASSVGVRVLITYQRRFDLRTLYHWVRFRAINSLDCFRETARSTFETWQAPGDWMPPTDASRCDQERIRLLIDHLLNNGYKKDVLSERLGVSTQYLGMLLRGVRDGSYGLQVQLELIRGPEFEERLRKPS